MWTVDTTFWGHWHRSSDVKRFSLAFHASRETLHGSRSYSIVPLSAFSRPCFFLLSIRLV